MDEDQRRFGVFFAGGIFECASGLRGRDGREEMEGEG